MARKRVTRILQQLLLVLLLAGTALVSGVIVDRRYLLDLVPPAQVPQSARASFGLMAEAWNLIVRNYVDRSAVKPRTMTYGAVSGMVNSLGDVGHSGFLTPKMLQDSEEVTRGEFAGVGAEIRMKDHQVVIVAPMDGSPAKKAGLRPGDVIVQVDGKDITGLSLQEVVRRIRGPAGTEVTLGVHDSEPKGLRQVKVVRADIPVVSVRWAMLPGTRVVHLRIGMFSKGTTGELDKALEGAQAQGADALILDLRSDPGGLLAEAIGVASRFLAGGDVLLVKNAQGETQPIPVKKEKEPPSKLPLVVLINKGSASASEIVSGALRDHGRAKLVGETTFGTGTVLQRFVLSDGSALMLAVEEWLTPKGKVIWHKGIEPDVTVSLPADAEPLLPEEEKNMSKEALAHSSDAQLLRALTMLQKASPQSAPPAAEEGAAGNSTGETATARAAGKPAPAQPAGGGSGTAAPAGSGAPSGD